MSFWLALSLARADLLPIEECTVERMGGPRRECRECSDSHRGRPSCEALEEEGFIKEKMPTWPPVSEEELDRILEADLEARPPRPPPPVREGT